MLIIIFVSVGLPVLIAFIVGLFAPASKGFQITAFNQTFSLFFAAASAVAVGVSGRMMGRLKDTLWWLPMWMAISWASIWGPSKPLEVEACQNKFSSNTDAYDLHRSQSPVAHLPR